MATSRFTAVMQPLPFSSDMWKKQGCRKSTGIAIRQIALQVRRPQFDACSYPPLCKDGATYR